MLATVTNTSGGDLNSNVVEDLTEVDGVSMGASGAIYVGGAISDPLPFPFGHIGTLADTAASILPMHPADFRRQEDAVIESISPRRLWLGMLQSGKVTLGQAQEVNRTDAEELFLTAV